MTRQSSKTIGLVSLGCARNLVDSEVALGSCIQAGYTYEPAIENCDIALINTCGFIDSAKQESVDAILELLQLKAQGRIQKVVVMGCLSQRFGHELQGELGEVDVFLGTNSFADVPAVLRDLETQERPQVILSRPRFLPHQRLPRKRLTAPHLAYVKVSEGCINACAYCAIPRMKGPHRSRRPEDILEEVDRLVSQGEVREINLIGQDVAAYGFDLQGRFLLAELLDRIALRTPRVWIRVLYAHPAHVTTELIDVFRCHTNICRYLDLPVEHTHPAVLQRMNRGSSRDQLDAVIHTLREQLPGVVLRTTVIVGFPGETEEEFEELVRSLSDYRFERLGAFVFSREEGTRAYHMPGQIPEAVKKRRLETVMDLQREISSQWAEAQVGKTLEVLVEEKLEEGVYSGRTQADAPEVDGQMIVRCPQDIAPGTFISSEVEDVSDFDLIGTADLRS